MDAPNKQGWTIARRCIAIATHQGGSLIGSQIFLAFVQAQTVKIRIHVETLLSLAKSKHYVTRSAAFVQYAGQALV